MVSTNRLIRKQMEKPMKKAMDLLMRDPSHCAVCMTHRKPECGVCLQCRAHFVDGMWHAHPLTDRTKD